MDPYYSDEQVTLHLGDSLAVLPTLADASIDAVVCDPPYGLAPLPAATVTAAIAAWLGGDRTHVPGGKGFMGRDWDAFVPPPGVWDECLRVLKPGGHLLAFAGTRTADLMGLSIRLAGFEIRDSLHWIYGSGMPKSLDVSKAIDKAAGAKRQITGQRDRYRDGRQRQNLGDRNEVYGTGLTANGVADVTAPATEPAARWSGWGTALRPAHEPIVLARKPLAGTVAATVLEHGTGAINIDGCRIATDEDTSRRPSVVGDTDAPFGAGLAMAGRGHAMGRWPSNVVLAHAALLNEHGAPVGDACADGCVPGCPVAEMDAQSGVSISSARGQAGGAFMSLYAQDATTVGMTRAERPAYGDAGGASRFFPIFRYEAKAPATERPRGADGSAHPTVKPRDLMQWLVRLVTPPGGLVCDPFAGTGTTLEAAALEDMHAIGIEQHEPYAELARTRLTKPRAIGLFAEPA